jgi:aspartate/methionine/tyrosine aminotransferase
VPSQHAIQTALGGYQSVDELTRPGGRLLQQRDHAWRELVPIPGIDCVKPAGALYLFAHLDPAVHKIHDDEKLVVDLLEQQHLLISHGSGFNIDTPDHLRLRCNRAVEAEVDIKVVQAFLGHSASVLTRDTYTSVSPRPAKEAAEMVAKMVPRRAG